MGRKGFALLAVTLALAVALAVTGIALTRIAQGAHEATLEWRKAQGEALLYGAIRDLLYPHLLGHVRERLAQAAAPGGPAEEVARRAAESLGQGAVLQGTGPGGVGFRAWIYLHEGVAPGGRNLPPGERLPRATLLEAYPQPQGARLATYSLPILILAEVGGADPLWRGVLRGSIAVLWGREVPTAWGFGLHGGGAPEVSVNGHVYLRRPPQWPPFPQLSGTLAVPGCLDSSPLSCSGRREGFQMGNRFVEALASPSDPFAPCGGGGCLQAPLGVDWRGRFVPLNLAGGADFTFPGGGRVSLIAQGGEQWLDVERTRYRIRRQGGGYQLLQGSTILAYSTGPLRLRLPSPSRVSGVLAEGTPLLLRGEELTLEDIVPERDPCLATTPPSCQPSTALLTLVADRVSIPSSTQRVHAVVLTETLEGGGSPSPVTVVGSLHLVGGNIPRRLQVVHNPLSVEAPLPNPGTGGETSLAVAFSPLAQ